MRSDSAYVHALTSYPNPASTSVAYKVLNVVLNAI